MLIENILECNRSFLAGRPQFLEAAGEPFAVIACMDPRLTGMLEQAMGLPRNRAAVIRIAGNRVTAGEFGVLRSIASAVYLLGVAQVLVVGHTDCRLASFPTAQVAEAFRKAGVPREAFGNSDLREWFGAFAGIQQNVLAAIQTISNAPMLPGNLAVHGFIIDTVTGALQVIRQDTAPKPAVALETAAPEHDQGRPPLIQGADVQEAKAPPPPLPHSSAAVKGAVVVPGGSGPVTPPAPQVSTLEAIWILREVLAQEKKDPQIRRSMNEIRSILSRERDPLRLLNELESILESLRGRYPRLPALIAYLRSQFGTPGSDSAGLFEILQRALHS